MQSESPIDRWKREHGAAELAERFDLAAQPDDTYKGPCPVCGGDDRFTLWPAEHSRTGNLQGHCRSGCGRTGDGFAWAMWAANLDPSNPADVRDFLQREGVRLAGTGKPNSRRQPTSSGAPRRRARTPHPPASPAPLPLPDATRRLLAAMPTDRREAILKRHPQWREAMDVAESQSAATTTHAKGENSHEFSIFDSQHQPAGNQPANRIHGGVDTNGAGESVDGIPWPALWGNPAEWSEAEREALQERAAIREFDGGMARPDAERAAVGDVRPAARRFRLIDALEADGLLHPADMITTTADCRRVWTHPDFAADNSNSAKAIRDRKASEQSGNPPPIQNGTQSGYMRNAEREAERGSDE